MYEHQIYEKAALLELFTCKLMGQELSLQLHIIRERTIRALSNTIQYEYSSICNSRYQYEYSLH